MLQCLRSLHESSRCCYCGFCYAAMPAILLICLVALCFLVAYHRCYRRCSRCSSSAQCEINLIYGLVTRCSTVRQTYVLHHSACPPAGIALWMERVHSVSQSWGVTMCCTKPEHKISTHCSPFFLLSGLATNQTTRVRVELFVMKPQPQTTNKAK